MTLRTTWMRYSHIGINLLLIFAVSCGGATDYIVKADWVYINESSYSINYGFVNGFSVLNSGEVYKFHESSEGSSSINEDSYVAPFGLSEIIIYNNIKCDTLYVGDNARGDNAEGILGVDNYKIIKISERYYEFTYIFTEADYLKAMDCQ
jgi:hypothetical protein